MLRRNGQLTLWDCNTDLTNLRKLNEELATKVQEISLDNDEDDIKENVDDDERFQAQGTF